jgi:hypothetical protein
MFSLKADDGIERTAEQYFKRYNPKIQAKAVQKNPAARWPCRLFHFFDLYPKTMGKPSE